MLPPILHILFYLSFFITLVISGYIFVLVIVFKKKDTLGVFTTWQFPMLLALFIDIVYYGPDFRNIRK